MSVPYFKTVKGPSLFYKHCVVFTEACVCWNQNALTNPKERHELVRHNVKQVRVKLILLISSDDKILVHEYSELLWGLMLDLIFCYRLFVLYATLNNRSVKLCCYTYLSFECLKFMDFSAVVVCDNFFLACVK